MFSNIVNQNLLCIAIPSYNSGNALISVVQKILSEIKIAKCESKVSILVSFNGPDSVNKAILEKIRTETQIEIIINTHESNIGFDLNYLSLFENGCIYTWPLGDDDLICSGFLPELVSFIENNNNVDYIHVGGFLEGSELKKPVILKQDFLSFVQLTNFRSGGMAATVIKNSVVNSIDLSKFDYFYRHWIHLAVIISGRNKYVYAVFHKNGFNEIDDEKRWLKYPGQKRINSDLWLATYIVKLSDSDYLIQREIDNIIFRSIYLRIIKDLVRFRLNYNFSLFIKRKFLWR